MFILQRYIIRQHIGPFLFGFFIITLLWILNLLFTRLGKLLSRGLSFSVILEFFLLNMAWIIALTLPMAVLMACLMAFGRMASDQEITAIKASGISTYRIITPVLITGILICLLLIWFNNAVLPDSNHKLALLMRDIHKKRPTITLEPGIIYRQIPNIHLMVQAVEEQENLSYVRGILIHDRSDSKINKTIIAKHGEISVDEKTGLFSITLYDGEMHEISLNKPESYRRLQLTKHLLTIPIANMALSRSESEFRSDREQSAQMMLEEVAKNREAMAKQNEDINAYIITQIQKSFTPISELTNNAENKQIKNTYRKIQYSLRNNIKKHIRTNKSIQQRINSSLQANKSYLFANSRLLVEVHKKYSIPFACVVFVLIGVPLGVLTRRGGMAIGGGISLIFFLIYWSFLIGGEELADRLLLSPFLAMWLANILVGGMGIYLVFYTVKEATPIRFENLKFLLPKKFR